MKGVGRDKIMINLNKQIALIEGRTQGGLSTAALLIKARALKQTPVDTGNLRASAYVVGGDTGAQNYFSRQMSERLKRGMATEYVGGVSPRIEARKKTKQPWAVVGYTASYAIYVHEMENVRHEIGNWKFLHNAIAESEKDILKIIKRSAKI